MTRALTPLTKLRHTDRARNVKTATFPQSTLVNALKLRLGGSLEPLRGLDLAARILLSPH